MNGDLPDDVLTQHSQLSWHCYTAWTQTKAESTICSLTARIHLAILCHYRPHTHRPPTHTCVQQCGPPTHWASHTHSYTTWTQTEAVASLHAYNLPSCVTTDQQIHNTALDYIRSSVKRNVKWLLHDVHKLITSQFISDYKLFSKEMTQYM